MADRPQYACIMAEHSDGADYIQVRKHRLIFNFSKIAMYARISIQLSYTKFHYDLKTCV